jgi:L-cysteine/cystine lyase
MTFEEVRGQFPVLERWAYLNAGTNGPLARATLEAVEEKLGAEARDGRGGGPYFERMLALRDETRSALAGVLGAPVDNVALVYSTTDACNVVLAGLGLGPGDEIVTTDEEHFGMLGPLAGSGARVRLAKTLGRPPEEHLDAILAEVGPRTRLLAISHASWISGNRLPIEALRGETELPILVDGAQSVGAIPVDATPFDFYTVSCQKWLCAPDVTGALYVRDPEALRVARVGYPSAESYEPAGTFVPKAGARRFDTGWWPSSSLAGLCAAIAVRPEWAHERARETAGSLRERLLERRELVTAPDQATLVSWREDGDTAELVKALYEAGVIVRELPGRGIVRASCGFWTSDGDLDRLLDALPA